LNGYAELVQYASLLHPTRYWPDHTPDAVDEQIRAMLDIKLPREGMKGK
jgi:hypothetical protein